MSQSLRSLVGLFSLFIVIRRIIFLSQASFDEKSVNSVWSSFFSQRHHSYSLLRLSTKSVTMFNNMKNKIREKTGTELPKFSASTSLFTKSRSNQHSRQNSQGSITSITSEHNLKEEDSKSSNSIASSVCIVSYSMKNYYYGLSHFILFSFFIS